MLQIFSDYPCKSAVPISVLLAEMMVDALRALCFFAVDFAGMNGIFSGFRPAYMSATQISARNRTLTQ